jgi:hypothetical protein
MTQSYKLIYILGSGRCGSTLLDLLLNGHSQILGLGEVVTLNSVFNPFNMPAGRKVGFQESYLPFWQDVRRCYESLTDTAFADLNIRHPRWRTIPKLRADDIASWAYPNKMLLASIQCVSGARMLVDASKFGQRLYLLQQSSFATIQVIHLVRDGRAVVNSYIRRYNDFNAGLRLWVTTALASFYLRRQFQHTDWLQVRYEHLAMRPEETLQNICAFLGLTFEHNMLAYRSRPYFGIGGNPLVMESEEERIVLDERWKQELSSKHQLIFATVAGWLNKLYGY